MDRMHSPEPGFSWTGGIQFEHRINTLFYVARVELDGSRLSVYIQQEIVDSETLRPLPDPRNGQLEVQQRVPPPSG